MAQVEKKPRKKHERGLTKRALAEIRHLLPNFTSHHLAARTQMGVDQASKICGYLRTKGYLEVVGVARLTGIRGEGGFIYAPTKAYEKARKANPELFEGLKVVPKSLEAAREKKQAGGELPEMTPARSLALCQKIDGVIEVVDNLVLLLHSTFTVAASRFDTEHLVKVRSQLKSLREIAPVI